MTGVIERFDAIALAILLPALAAGWRLRMTELRARALTLIGLLVLVSVAMAVGRAGIVAFALLILAGGALELARVGKVSAALAGIAAGAGFAAPLVPGIAEGVSLLAFVAVTASASLARRPLLARPWFVIAMAAALLGVGLGFLVRLDSLGAGAVVALVLTLQFNDGIGYAAGARFGRTHPFPGLSPGKSVEGYAAGLLGAGAAIVLLSTLDPVLRSGNWPDLVILGLCLVITANAGDLLLSRVKRGAQVKDFGNLLPGHGGVLDRFDGWLVTAPVLFVLCTALPVLARHP